MAVRGDRLIVASDKSAAQKALLRKKISRLRFSEAKRKKSSLSVCRKIEKTSFFRDAGTIGFYSAAQDEPDLSALAAKALSLNKKVFFPRVIGKKIEFREVRDLKKDFRPGAYQILEPHPKKTKKRVREPELILVPGRAFDSHGGRLGRGGGHYDRLLARWHQSVRIGVGFREQKVRRVPVDQHDIRMDAVITG